MSYRQHDALCDDAAWEDMCPACRGTALEDAAADRAEEARDDRCNS